MRITKTTRAGPYHLQKASSVGAHSVGAYKSHPFSSSGMQLYRIIQLRSTMRSLAITTLTILVLVIVLVEGRKRKDRDRERERERDQDQDQDQDRDRDRPDQDRPDRLDRPDRPDRSRPSRCKGGLTEVCQSVIDNDDTLTCPDGDELKLIPRKKDEHDELKECPKVGERPDRGHRRGRSPKRDRDSDRPCNRENVGEVSLGGFRRKFYLVPCTSNYGIILV
jgi:heme exporter protein D